MSIHKVVAKAPQWVKRGLCWTPPALSQQAIQLVLNQFFQPELKQGQLNFLTNRAILVQVQDLDLQFSVQKTGPRLKVNLPPVPGEVTFRGITSGLFLLVTQREDPDTLFFRRDLAVTGDTNLGLELKNLLDTIELSERLPKPLYQLTEQFADALEVQLEAGKCKHPMQT